MARNLTRLRLLFSVSEFSIPGVLSPVVRETAKVTRMYYHQ